MLYLAVSVTLFCFLFQNVHGTCSDILSYSVPASIRIKENVTGLQFNIPKNETGAWSIDVTRINGEASTKQKRDYALRRFNLTVNNDTNSLLLYVTEPLDLEDFYRYLRIQITSISLELKCGPTDVKEIAVIVIPVEEFPPEFIEKPYAISIKENTPVKTPIFDVKSKVQQKDVGSSKQFYYHIDRYSVDTGVDGSLYFDLAISTDGIIKVKRLIDYDKMTAEGKPTYLMLQLRAEGLSGLKSTTTLNISITDEDDQGPVFSICAPPCRNTYRSNTQTSYRGFLTIYPSPIKASDPDSFNNTIIYSLEPVAFNRRNAFTIGRQTGQISQIGDVYTTGVLTIKATEISVKGLSEFATILVSLGNDTTAPPLVGKTIKDDESSNLKLALIILGVLALLIIIGIIVVFYVYHKKVAKAVKPSDDDTDISISHSQNWQGSKAELLAGDMLNPAVLANMQGAPPLTKDSATETGRKRSRRRNKNKEPEIFDGTREYEGKLDLDFFMDSNTKSKIKQSTRSRDTKTDPKYWITIPNDDE